MIIGIIQFLAFAAFIGSTAAVVWSYFFAGSGYDGEEKTRAAEMRKLKMRWYGWLGVGASIVFIFVSLAFKVVPVGHTSVASIFGKVKPVVFDEGIHFPVNPLNDWNDFDARQKTLLLEDVGVPSRDQMTTKLDVSIQFRIIGSEAAQTLQNTGTADQVVAIHLVPKTRSLLREQGKTVARAEDFFNETVQQEMQTSLETGLGEFMVGRGIEVQEVLIRDITLPGVILTAVESKKEREQAVDKQRAELERQKLEAEQQVVVATAANRAAEQEAERIERLAEAQAKAIKLVNEASASDPAYIQLEALKALQAISKDPAAKVYFMNGESPNPLPLMHMGEIGGNK